MIPLKIVQFITRMDVLGGAQMHVCDLAKGLQKKGHDVIVISMGTNSLTEEMRGLGIPYYSLKYLIFPLHPVKDFLCILELRKLLKMLAPDLLAIHSSKAGIIGRVAGRSLHIPTIFTAHSWSFSPITNPVKKYIYIYLEKVIGALTSGIITVSHYNLQETEQYRIAPRTIKKVIHNGVTDSTVIAFPALQQPVIQLIMVARFARPKDHQLLLEALTFLPKKKWCLTLIGDGPLLEKIRVLAAELDLTEQIVFLGEVRDIDRRLAEADLFFLISKSEGLPISIMEAMRARLTIIASDVGGIGELIEHNHSGLLVRPDQITDLVAAIHLLLANPTKRLAMAYAAREKYQTQFSFQSMLQKTERFYQQITDIKS